MSDKDLTESLEELFAKCKRLRVSSPPRTAPAPPAGPTPAGGSAAKSSPVRTSFPKAATPALPPAPPPGPPRTSSPPKASTPALPPAPPPGPQTKSAATLTIFPRSATANAATPAPPPPGPASAGPPPSQRTNFPGTMSFATTFAPAPGPASSATTLRQTPNPAFGSGQPLTSDVDVAFAKHDKGIEFLNIEKDKIIHIREALESGVYDLAKAQKTFEDINSPIYRQKILNRINELSKSPLASSARDRNFQEVLETERKITKAAIDKKREELGKKPVLLQEAVPSLNPSELGIANNLLSALEKRGEELKALTNAKKPLIDQMQTTLESYSSLLGQSTRTKLTEDLINRRNKLQGNYVPTVSAANRILLAAQEEEKERIAARRTRLANQQREKEKEKPSDGEKNSGPFVGQIPQIADYLREMTANINRLDNEFDIRKTYSDATSLRDNAGQQIEALSRAERLNHSDSIERFNQASASLDEAYRNAMSGSAAVGAAASASAAPSSSPPPASPSPKPPAPPKPAPKPPAFPLRPAPKAPGSAPARPTLPPPAPTGAPDAPAAPDAPSIPAAPGIPTAPSIPTPPPLPTGPVSIPKPKSSAPEDASAAPAATATPRAPAADGRPAASASLLAAIKGGAQLKKVEIDPVTGKPKNDDLAKRPKPKAKQPPRGAQGPGMNQAVLQNVLAGLKKQGESRPTSPAETKTDMAGSMMQAMRNRGMIREVETPAEKKQRLKRDFGILNQRVSVVGKDDDDKIREVLLRLIDMFRDNRNREIGDEDIVDRFVRNIEDFEEAVGYVFSNDVRITHGTTVRQLIEAIKNDENW